MSRLYAAPLRVYLLLGLLAVAGIYSGFQLPISLFPNSSKPRIAVFIPYGAQNADEFLHTFGINLEAELRGISTDRLQVDRLTANYGPHMADYAVEFRWGNSPILALKEVQTVVDGFSARLPVESRTNIQIWPNNGRSSGFLAVSFYSDRRKLNEVYRILEPVLMPEIEKLNETGRVDLWNPDEKEVHIELNPNAMAVLQILPRDVESAVSSALGGLSGGTVAIDHREMQIELPRQIATAGDLSQLTLATPAGRMIHLSDVARVEMGPRSLDQWAFNTDGAPSLVLNAKPKAGGNVKKMTEDILQLVRQTMKDLPSDLHYRILVDPSAFIRASIGNVMREVAMAAFLAVAVLFLFIGSVRNVVTAAIEIPLSLVLAFILMRFMGINLNLISLGGLALSAGMNVDASVVVLENIIRHFESQPVPPDFPSRLRVVTRAVREVQFAVIASTLSSIIVFLPLTFTSDLAYGVLGDLAFAVVFSHGFSALVALVLVPTVRLQMMAKHANLASHSPIEPLLKRLEAGYAQALGWLLARPWLKGTLYLALPAVLLALAGYVLPRLPREIIGRPDTDILSVQVETKGNTLIQQMEIIEAEVERSLTQELGPSVRYTTAEMELNGGHIEVRLKDKSQMAAIRKRVEQRLKNTPTVSYTIDNWNPSELPIPDPPALQIAIRGGSARERWWAASEISDGLQATKAYPRVFTEPQGSAQDQAILIEPHREQWAAIRAQGSRLDSADLADVIRVSTNGRQIGNLPLENRLTPIVLRFPRRSVSSLEDVGAFPVGVGAKLVPLRALANVVVQPASPPIRREDNRELVKVNGRLDSDAGSEAKAAAEHKARQVVEQWRAAHASAGIDTPTVTIEDAAKDLTEAIHQLGMAVALSCGLIFVTLLLQFGSVIEALLVLVAVPAGFIGVLLSLYLFRSTLSLNSILGVILLNGISVANSIILVDFIKQRVAAGLGPVDAAVDAARKRLRPILITSLTTMLGMLPIALGAGEGGKILQPLGIAVAGGLWVSMLLTLFLVPSLQVSYLLWSKHRSRRSSQPGPLVLSLILSASLVFAAAPVRAEERALSFDEAVQAILARSTGIATQRETLEQTRAQNLPDHLTLLPKLSVVAGVTNSNSLGIGQTQQGAGAVLDVNLYRFGADAAAMRAANAEERAQLAKIQDQRLKSEEEGINALVDFLQTRKQIAALSDLVAFEQELYHVTQERFQRGQEAEEYVDTIGVDLANLEAQLHDAELAGYDAQANLVRLLGHTRVALTWPWSDRIGGPLTKLVSSPIDLSARSDWRAAQENVEGARQRMKQKFGKMLPSLDAEVSYGYYQYTYNSSLIPNPPPGPQFGGFVNLTIPLFDRLSGYGDYQSQVHVLAVSELNQEEVRRSAESDWKAAREATLVAQKESTERDKTLAVSRRIYKNTLQRYRRGQVTANDLAVDQQRSFNAEQNAISGWATLHRRFAHLCHTAGLEVPQCLNGR